MAAAVVAESLKIVCAVPSVMIQPASTSLPSDGPCTDCGAIYIPLPSYDDITKVHLPPNKMDKSAISSLSRSTCTLSTQNMDFQRNICENMKNQSTFESTLSMAPSLGINNDPICRICHQTEAESESALICPCRCIGSMKYIHNTCLLRWLAICTKRSRKPARCELCLYIFHRHKHFKRHHWRLPKVSRRDTILHACFLINVFIMVVCAVATVMCFLSDRGQIRKFPSNKATLTTEEVVTLACGVLFFVSFFLAMSVQIRARYTVYQLLVKFIGHNMEWQIFEYDASQDNSKITSDKRSGVKGRNTGVQV